MLDDLDYWVTQKANIDKVDCKPFGIQGSPLSILREDQLLDEVSGNKLRKLLPNLMAAKAQGINRIVTFGGAYSNHIAATAAAGQRFGFDTLGLIRGEELSERVKDNPTLHRARERGMELKFLSRADYRRRSEEDFLNTLEQEFGHCMVVPEGGSNDLAKEGVAQMLRDLPNKYRIICTPIGSGGTMAGLLKGANKDQEIWGFSALKGIDFNTQLSEYGQGIQRKIFDQYHFGGYAKANNDLIQFINNFKAVTGIPLDPIYTAKMMFGLIDFLIKNPKIDLADILVIHTGGLQGILGFNKGNETLINIQ